MTDDEPEWPDYSHLPPYWKVAETAKEIAREVWPDEKFYSSAIEWTTGNYQIRVCRSVDNTEYGTVHEEIRFEGNEGRGWGCFVLDKSENAPKNSPNGATQPLDGNWLELGYDAEPDRDRLISTYRNLATQRVGDNTPSPLTHDYDR